MKLTTDEMIVIDRFLEAAAERVDSQPGRIPLDARTARLAIAWLRGLAAPKDSQ